MFISSRLQDQIVRCAPVSYTCSTSQGCATHNYKPRPFILLLSRQEACLLQRSCSPRSRLPHSLLLLRTFDKPPVSNVQAEAIGIGRNGATAGARVHSPRLQPGQPRKADVWRRRVCPTGQGQGRRKRRWLWKRVLGDSPTVRRWKTLLTVGIQRIFSYAGRLEYTFFAISIVAAIASGAGIALQNLIFGRFVTIITDYASQKSSAADFRSEAAELAYVTLCL